MASSTISSVEPHRAVVKRWFDAGVQGHAIHAALKRVPELIEDASNELTGAFRLLVQRLMDQLKGLDQQVSEMEL